jgi:hypothetical protein
MFPVFIYKPLAQPEVDEIQRLLLTIPAHADILGLDIPMDKVLVVEVLQPRDHLFAQHANCLHRKPLLYTYYF